MFFKVGVPKIFTDFTGKHLCWNLRPATLLKRDSCEICEIFKNIFFIDQVILEGGVTQRGKNWDHVFQFAIALLLT